MQNPIIPPLANPKHPLQQDAKSGPKRVYSAKIIEDKIHVRVDMPGISEDRVHVFKANDNKTILFLGTTPAEGNKEWKQEARPARRYSGKIQIECEDFDKVSFVRHFTNGSCRIVISGAISASLVRGDQQALPMPVEERHCHLQPDSIIVEGSDSVDFDVRICYVCGYPTSRYSINGPWTEQMVCINPFVIQGKASVFECMFEEIDHEPGNYHMFFRLDMPDCTEELLKFDITRKYMLISAKKDPNLHQDLTREYFAQLSLRCECCDFENPSYLLCDLSNGVLKTIVRIIGNRDGRHAPTISNSRDVCSCHDEQPSTSYATTGRSTPRRDRHT